MKRGGGKAKAAPSKQPIIRYAASPEGIAAIRDALTRRGVPQRTIEATVAKLRANP